jgi:hypothetical protein
MAPKKQLRWLSGLSSSTPENLQLHCAIEGRGGSSKRHTKVQASDVLSIVYLPEKEKGSPVKAAGKRIKSASAKQAALAAPYMLWEGQEPRTAAETAALRKAGHTVCEPDKGFKYRSIEQEEDEADSQAAMKRKEAAERREKKRT